MSEGKGVIIVAGYGIGISRSVALKFGKERGYTVALLARTQSKLDAAAQELNAIGVKAGGFPVDFNDPKAVVKTIEEVRVSLGEVSILFWNGGIHAKKGWEATTSEDIHANITTNVDSLLAATKAVQKDLEKHKGAVLVTGGCLGMDSEPMAQMAVDWEATTWALQGACKRKLVHILHLALKPLGVFVGEVTVCALVKGTAADAEGKATLTAEAVAEAFAGLLDRRDAAFAQIA